MINVLLERKIRRCRCGEAASRTFYNVPDAGWIGEDLENVLGRAALVHGVRQDRIFTKLSWPLFEGLGAFGVCE